MKEKRNYYIDYNNYIDLLLGMVVSGNLAEFLLEFAGHHNVVLILQLLALLLGQKLRRDTVEVVEDHHGGVEKTSVLVIDRLARATVDTAGHTGESRLASSRHVLLDTLSLLGRHIRRKLALGEVLLEKSVLSSTKSGLHPAVREETTCRIRRLELVGLDVTRDERSQDTRGRHALADEDVNVVLELVTLGLGRVKRTEVGSLVESDKLVRNIEERVELGVGTSSLAFAVSENLTEFTKLRNISSRILADVTALDGVTTWNLKGLVSRNFTKFRSQTDNSFVSLLKVFDVLRKFLCRARTIVAGSSYRSGGECGCHFY